MNTSLVQGNIVSLQIFFLVLDDFTVPKKKDDFTVTLARTEYDCIDNDLFLESFVYGELLSPQMKYTSRVSVEFLIYNEFVYEYQRQFLL